jgi:hypothetical protein
MMLLALYCACIIFPAPHSGSPVRPSSVPASYLLQGYSGCWPTKAAVFIFACVPIISLTICLIAPRAASRKWLFAVGLAGSLLVFLLTAFVVPAANLALGQTPIDLWTTITRGVYNVMFLTSSRWAI